MRVGTWSAVERELAEAMLVGRLLDLSTRADQIIRAEVIRELMLGSWPDDLDRGLPKQPDPNGVMLHGATIAGRVNLDYVRARIRLQLTDTYIPEGVSLCWTVIPDVHISGVLGSLSESSPAFDAVQIAVEHDLGLLVRINGSYGLTGAVRLIRGHIGGQFAMAGASLVNSSGSALNADGLVVDGFSNLVFTATGQGHLGSVNLHGAHFGRELNMASATLVNSSGPALDAEGLTVDGRANLALAGNGYGQTGAVCLLNACFNNQLDMSGAILSNNAGPAMVADGLSAHGSTRFVFTATGHSPMGAVRLSGAHFANQIDMRSATLTNNSGPALNADSLRVDGAAHLGFTANGHGSNGAVRLNGAHIGGQLVISDATFANATGPALAADRLAVGEDASFGLLDAGENLNGFVSLRDARIGGRISGTFDDTAQKGGLVSIDGLTYAGTPVAGVTSWLELLRKGTRTYSAQPYRQLAGATAAAGHDADTRKILMSQRRDQISRAGLRTRDRLWGKFLGLVLGYGYQPWRALLCLLGVVAASAVLTTVVGSHGLHHPAALGQLDESCSVAERAMLGADNALPLITTTLTSTCMVRPAPNVAAQAVTGIAVGAQALGYLCTTLFVVGFTAAVRKT